MDILLEFFGFGGHRRTPEGAYSWQHLTFVTGLMIIMIGLSVFLGKRYQNATPAGKNKPILWAAILIDSFELLKIVLFCVRGKDPYAWLYELPLFLCSIQLITIPLAALSRGRLREAALDFISIFGILGAVLGTYGAAQNYAAYPVLSFDNVVSGITHSISGFTSLYILISGQAGMKKKNIPITFAVLLSFCVAAFLANKVLDYNYMFLEQGDGTPYDILFNLVNGNPVLYPLGVVGLFLIYITAFYAAVFLVRSGKAAARQKKQAALHNV